MFIFNCSVKYENIFAGLIVSLIKSVIWTVGHTFAFSLLGHTRRRGAAARGRHSPPLLCAQRSVRRTIITNTNKNIAPRSKKKRLYSTPLPFVQALNYKLFNSLNINFFSACPSRRSLHSPPTRCTPREAEAGAEAAAAVAEVTWPGPGETSSEAGSGAGEGQEAERGAGPRGRYNISSWVE